jgi:hypothetical protein
LAAHFRIRRDPDAVLWNHFRRVTLVSKHDAERLSWKSASPSASARTELALPASPSLSEAGSVFAAFEFIGQLRALGCARWVSASIASGVAARSAGQNNHFTPNHWSTVSSGEE